MKYVNKNIRMLRSNYNWYDHSVIFLSFVTRHRVLYEKEFIVDYVLSIKKNVNWNCLNACDYSSTMILNNKVLFTYHYLNYQMNEKINIIT